MYSLILVPLYLFFFFFNDPAPTEIYPLSLHDALPIYVQAARIVNRVQPVYPPLARQTRISGTVRLHAIISRDGTIQQLEVISGHPLLQQAALDAVRQWRYQPTLLNGEPVEVDTTIDVIFSLNQ